MDRLPAPCRLDDKDRFPQSLLHEDSKGELGPDLVTSFCRVFSGTETSGQFAEAFPHVVSPTSEIGYPDLIANNGIPLFINHFLQDGLGQRISPHRLEGAYLGMAFHVGLAAKNEDLEGFGVSSRTGQEAQGDNGEK